MTNCASCIHVCDTGDKESVSTVPVCTIAAEHVQAHQYRYRRLGHNVYADEDGKRYAVYNGILPTWCPLGMGVPAA